MRMLYALLGAAALQAGGAALAADTHAPMKSTEVAKAVAQAKPEAEAKSDAKADSKLAPDAVLISDGPTKVDARDLDAFMLRIPENMRVPFRSSYDRVASAVDSIYVTRVAAERAREAGLDKDPAVQRRLQQVQESFLADLYVQKIQKEVDSVDLDQRAKEIYAAEPKQFTKPEEVYVQEILIGLNGRTPDMARERAQKVYADATQGKEDFLQLAAKYSDDPDKVRNGGDIGFYSPSHFAAPVADAIAKLDKKGEIAGPIQTPQGFYIVRFVDRHPPRVASFDEVKRKIIDTERERLRKEKMERFLAQVRGSKTVITNSDNVAKYVIEVNPATGETKAPTSSAAPAPTASAK